MDKEFAIDKHGLDHALALMQANFGEQFSTALSLDKKLPERGMGSQATLDFLAPSILGGAARLGNADAFAHMDPPTPWITWATTLWNASLNQNLLHPAAAPIARDVEACVVDWLAPYFGMQGGHMTPGSTLANLTALWAARDAAGVREVISSDSAHMSIGKAAKILGLKHTVLPSHRNGTLQVDALPADLSRSALVLTAGTTSTGGIDPLALAGRAAWTHVDAAWAGPLRLTRFEDQMKGIENADSVSVSAHKWLFQPKESALVFFKNVGKANAAISFGGAYLAAPNIGVLGSHGAVAVPLLATLLAWGREGLAQRIEFCMQLAEQFSQFAASEPRLELLNPPQTGVVVWRAVDATQFDTVYGKLPAGAHSTTKIAGERWFRSVAANPNADIAVLIDCVKTAIK